MTLVHRYKGYAIHKPEGCTYWNVHEIDSKGIDWCFSVAHCKSLKEAKATINASISEQEVANGRNHNQRVER